MDSKKAYRVVEYKAGNDRYTIDYFRNSTRQCTFTGKRDTKKDGFWLTLDVRYSYGEVPKRKFVFFDDCTWEI